MRLVPIVMLAFTTLACISAKDLTPERCGPEPTISQAEWGAHYFVQNVGLKDPASAQIRNIRIVERHGQANIHGNIYGWLVTFELNAKNSFGGYVGFKPIEIMMLDGGTRVWYSGYIPE
jgi:hypothetical protein